MLVSPCHRIDSMVRAMQDGDVDAAELELTLMCDESPAVGGCLNMALEASDSSSWHDWLVMANHHGLFGSHCALGDKLWLMDGRHRELGTMDFFETYKSPVDADRRNPIVRTCREALGVMPPVTTLFSVYLMTRRSLAPSLGTWLPGSTSSDVCQASLPRYRDAVRICAMMAHVMALGPGTEPLEAACALFDLSSPVTLGDVTVMPWGRPLGTDGRGDAVIHFGWKRGNDPLREMDVSAKLAADVMLTGAWDLLTWLYADASDATEARSYEAGYVLSITKTAMACDVMPDCDDDGPIIAKIHVLARS